jgi:Spy/CpxP family protein refolding chaperone
MIAIIAASGLLFSPTLRAQDAAPDAKKDAKPAAAKGKKGGGRGGLTLDQLKEQLKLDDKTTAKVKPIWEERTKKISDLTASNPSAQDRRTKMQAITDETNKKMKEVLTAEQYKQFEAMPQAAVRAGKGKKAADAGAPPAPAAEKKADAPKK